MSGFTYHEHKYNSLVRVKLGGKDLSLRQLVNAAEAMRLELLKHGIAVQLPESHIDWLEKAHSSDQSKTV